MTTRVEGFVSVRDLARSLSRRVRLSQRTREALGEVAADADELSKYDSERCSSASSEATS